ncbi:PEP-CTERM sorting domain-containing protein [Roseateles saccharophilus]|uniref:Putative secreted protein with PEP-CTERM sorting signal n=1 Tax=Roseateles saccharophilus TaxID=304 RepID=A0A4R3UF92_ROSSA|nr:PEP-CTERM sorting domain-containing protein [Roseateles saccharophilus]MDG0835198.1 PEP-CTERM sorting domain-containing protein [Roseateles saccharophilus]TCU87130.1 putative secreted protein with PEP-CTERM sorting signal [Roseateles saccharophilus]
MKHIAVAGLFAAGILAAQAAGAATTVNIKWQGLDTSGTKLSTMDTTVSSTTPITSNYATSALNYTNLDTGSSFVAYCVEPLQGNGRAGIARAYSVESFGGVQAQQLQGLFSTAYAGLSTYNDKAAFQLAVWEMVLETGSTLDVNSGSFHISSTDAVSTQVASEANSFLAQALAYTGPARYTLTKLTNPQLQDLITATPLSAVPEPESYALFLGGLGIVGLLVRRRLPR